MDSSFVVDSDVDICEVTDLVVIGGAVAACVADCVTVVCVDLLSVDSCVLVCSGITEAPNAVLLVLGVFTPVEENVFDSTDGVGVVHGFCVDKCG